MHVWRQYIYLRHKSHVYCTCKTLCTYSGAFYSAMSVIHILTGSQQKKKMRTFDSNWGSPYSCADSCHTIYSARQRKRFTRDRAFSALSTAVLAMRLSVNSLHDNWNNLKNNESTFVDKSVTQLRDRMFNEWHHACCIILHINVFLHLQHNSSEWYFLWIWTSGGVEKMNKKKAKRE